MALSSILTFLGLAIAAVLIVLGLLAAVSGIGVIAAGRILESLFDLLVPARRTGLGPEGLIGESAEVVSEFVAPRPDRPAEGTVRVLGELWKARIDGPGLPAVHQQVRIVAIDGLVAMVAPLD